jgi:hypothetical protein
MSIEIDIDGHNYRLDKLPAMLQLHVSRRIAPLIPTAIGPFLSISAMKGGVDKNIEAIVSQLQPFADGLAGLSDADAEYVLGTCLGVIRRQNGEQWGADLAKRSNDVRRHRSRRDGAAHTARHHRQPRPFYSRRGYRPSSEGSGLEGVTWHALPGGEDWLLAPVMAGMCHFESLKNGDARSRRHRADERRARP